MKRQRPPMNGTAALVDLNERLEFRVTHIQVAVATNRDTEWPMQLYTCCPMSVIPGERTVNTQNVKVRWIGVGYHEVTIRQHGDADWPGEALFPVGCLLHPPGERAIRVETHHSWRGEVGDVHVALGVHGDPLPRGDRSRTEAIRRAQPTPQNTPRIEHQDLMVCGIDYVEVSMPIGGQTADQPCPDWKRHAKIDVALADDSRIVGLTRHRDQRNLTGTRVQSQATQLQFRSVPRYQIGWVLRAGLDEIAIAAFYVTGKNKIAGEGDVVRGDPSHEVLPMRKVSEEHQPLRDSMLGQQALRRGSKSIVAAAVDVAEMFRESLDRAEEERPGDREHRHSAHGYGNPTPTASPPWRP